ncbi:hypothetical protein [Desulfonatronum parangueonense]
MERKEVSEMTAEEIRVLRNEFKLLNYGFIEAPRGDLSGLGLENELAWLKDTARENLEIVEKAQREATKIRTDADLSDKGKARKLQELIESFKDKVKAALDAQTTVFSSRLVHEGKLMDAVAASAYGGPRTDAEKITDALEQTMIRQKLMTMKQGDRLSTYRQASEKGDVNLVRAFENAHSILGLVEPEAVELVRYERTARNHPQLVAAVEGVKDIHTCFKHNLSRLDSLLTETFPKTYGPELRESLGLPVSKQEIFPEK